jgi:pyrroloquinoline quinone biosynthesis protein E
VRRLAILDEVNKYEITHVQLIGGEVTTLPDLPLYLDHLPDAKWRSIVTNGRIFVPDLIGRVNEVYLSLHGDKEMHETLTKARDSFETVVDTIRNYVSYDIVVHSDTVLTSRNAHLVYEIAAHAKELGMSSLFLNIFQPAGIGQRKGNELAPSLDQIREAITQMLRARDEMSFKISFGTSTPFCLDERLVTEGLAFTCGVGDWFASIDPWGEFRVCNQSAKSYGNVLERPLHEIWHSKAISQDYRSFDWLQEPCRSCEFQAECHGGCRVDGAGNYRIDLTVLRDIDRLVTPQRLAELRPYLREQ